CPIPYGFIPFYLLASPSIFSFKAESASKSPKVDFSAPLSVELVEVRFPDPDFFALTDASSLKVAVWESTILLSSLENSVTLKSSASPTSTTEPSSFSRFLMVAKPSNPYGSSNTAPLSFLETTVHLWTDPAGKMLSKVSQGFSSNCL